MLKNLSPKLNEGEYVFCTVPEDSELTGIETLATFLEGEGRTLVMKKEIADHLNLEYHTVMSWISLNVYSSLEAVGLLARVSSLLAKNNICCNVISAYYHDHIFVPKNDGHKALSLLRKMMENPK